MNIQNPCMSFKNIHLFEYLRYWICTNNVHINYKIEFTWFLCEFIKTKFIQNLYEPMEFGKFCDVGNLFHNLKLGVENFFKKNPLPKPKWPKWGWKINVFHNVKLGFEEDDENIPSQRARWSGPFSRKKTRIFHSQRSDCPGFWGRFFMTWN